MSFISQDSLKKELERVRALLEAAVGRAETAERELRGAQQKLKDAAALAASRKGRGAGDTDAAHAKAMKLRGALEKAVADLKEAIKNEAKTSKSVLNIDNLLKEAEKTDLKTEKAGMTYKLESGKKEMVSCWENNQAKKLLFA